MTASFVQVDPGPPRDMYMCQMEAFIGAVKGEPSPDIRSSFASAAKTYEVTQLIQVAATKHRSPARFEKLLDGPRDRAGEE